MKCHRSYPIVHLENFSPDTIKMADILLYNLRCGKVCIGKLNEKLTTNKMLF